METTEEALRRTTQECELLRKIVDGSVLQRWVMSLPLRHQGVLLAAVRSCDTAAKPGPAELVLDGDEIETPERLLVAYMRYCILNPADPREVDYPGAFMRPDPPDENSWKPSQFGHYPQHWYAHIMHAFQIIGYYHPQHRNRIAGWTIYERFVHNLHLNTEDRTQMDRRLTEDRIETGTVVS
jgi:hypothetical protein